MDLNIVKMQEKYIESFWTALDSVAKERKYLQFIEAPPINATKAFLTENIIKNYSQFLAISEEEVVGWCDIIPLCFDGFQHVGTLGMGILQEFRGQGIGNIIIDKTIKDAWSKGISRIELEVFASNIPAIKLYEKCGFIHEGRKRMKRFIDKKWDDNLIMGLLKEDFKTYNKSAIHGEEAP